jgi:hypothetical protein
MKSRISRRGFLKDAALGGAGLLVLSNSGSARSYQANEKLNVALIGVGGRGRWFVGTIPKLDANVVAMCDVNERKASLSFEEIPTAKKYFDFRRMLEEMDKQIDAVVIAVPDHTHAIASATAMKMGKHVYCEKPLTRTLSEARTLWRQNTKSRPRWAIKVRAAKPSAGPSSLSRQAFSATFVKCTPGIRAADRATGPSLPTSIRCLITFTGIYGSARQSIGHTIHAGSAAGTAGGISVRATSVTGPRTR